MLRPRRIHLLPPVSYQGGKRRQAPEIVRHMALDPETPFVELCCGSGAVSLELISRGHNPAKITMVDAGPWGDVWRLVGAGEFDLRTLEVVGSELLAADKHCAAIPSLLSALAADVTPHSPLAPYAFLFLQSGAFGCKAIYDKGGAWALCGWSKPGDTQHPPLVPEPSVLVERMRRICPRAAGVTGMRADVATVPPRGRSVGYLDPPYKGSTGYGHNVEALEIARAWSPSPVFVSERVRLTAGARQVRHRDASGMSGASASDSSEYLSLFNADWPTPDIMRVEQLVML